MFYAMNDRYWNTKSPNSCVSFSVRQSSAKKFLPPMQADPEFALVSAAGGLLILIVCSPASPKFSQIHPNSVSPNVGSFKTGLV